MGGLDGVQEAEITSLFGAGILISLQPSLAGSPHDAVSIPANPVPEDVVSGTIKTPDGAELRFARWLRRPGAKAPSVSSPARRNTSKY
jgi:hypothetical protein